MSRRVLIFTASFGNGHLAAARNLAKALKTRQPDAEVGVSDIFLEVYPVRARLAARAYLLAIHRLPGVWSGIFSLLHHTPAVQAHIGFYRAALKKMDRRISEFRPEVVVSTYPGCNHLLDFWCKRRVARPFRTFTIITDSQTVNSAWHTAHADHFCVADRNTAAILEGRGIPPKKIHALGFPVPVEFASLEPRQRKPGPPWKVLYLIQDGSGRAVKTARKIAEVPGVELTIGVARHPRPENRLRQIPGVVEVGGWLENLPARMCESHFYVGKAGGASIHECLAAGLPIILNQIVPGQEEGNAQLVLDAGAGMIACSPEAAAEALRQATAAGGALQSKMAERALALGRTRASLDIAELILKNP